MHYYTHPISARPAAPLEHDAHHAPPPPSLRASGGRGGPSEGVKVCDDRSAFPSSLLPPPMCQVDVVVVGSSCVTRAGGRLGKGEGFAELEYGILRWMGPGPHPAT